jgi:pilus assembly protein Flp/PilA
MLKTYVNASARLARFKSDLAADESGAALVEYTVLIGLITVGAVASVALVGTWVSTHWSTLQTTLAAH